MTNLILAASLCYLSHHSKSNWFSFRAANNSNPTRIQIIKAQEANQGCLKGSSNNSFKIRGFRNCGWSYTTFIRLCRRKKCGAPFSISMALSRVWERALYISMYYCDYPSITGKYYGILFNNEMLKWIEWNSEMTHVMFSLTWGSSELGTGPIPHERMRSAETAKEMFL